MKHKLCLELNGHTWPIKLIQTGIDRFRVVYGLQVKDGLNYAAAAQNLGASIMHRLACDGELDNRERKVRRSEWLG
jgi:hypothetical protein